MVDQGLVLTTRLSNPLGGTMPEERQKQLLRLASDFDIQIVEDDIYGELMFEQGAPRRSRPSTGWTGDLLLELLQDLSPGVRVGWMIAGRTGRNPASADLHHAFGVQRDADGRCGLLENGGYDRHLRYIRQEYRKNLSAFQLAVQQYFPKAPR
jgi:DNA-binding transcriptional MocR family regulator